MPRRLSLILFSLGCCLFYVFPLHAKIKYAYTDVAFDYPVDGGGTLMVSRMWALNNHFHVGVVGGGGVIRQDWDIKSEGDQPPLTATVKTTVVPYIGPRISFFYEIIGLSLSYGVFHGQSQMDVADVSPALSGQKSAWATGIYSPLITLDFYSRKHDLVFGFGLGGFFNSSFPDLVADNGVMRVVSEEDPFESLSFHVHMLWADGRSKRLKNRGGLE